MPKRKDALLIAAVLVLAGLLLAVSRLMPKTNIEEKTADVTMAPDAVTYVEPTAEPQATTESEATAEPQATTESEATAEPQATDAPQAASDTAAMGPMPMPQTQEVRGHVVITVGKRQYGDPIAMDREKVITVKQTDGKINKVHITPEKVYMESSSCDNQDCVGQGEITLDNYKTRILSTFVICLPNEVTIEMVPVE
ncbi:MAG: NusG domain II-containing protein [Clostridia bacterium]|nr:NusG domain II-containing protein [Clostridia bacterium]